MKIGRDRRVWRGIPPGGTDGYEVVLVDPHGKSLPPPAPPAVRLGPRFHTGGVESGSAARMRDYVSV
ncbi:hypothetical protein [Nocardia suismassiliense]|uniref:hypothetical protein n=1 Tax=Nocardia suismassiliense TaxID=2077092 RepID=UPI000D1E052E|nr:hypothetical protein [Nocardia suismassiliense]